MTSSEAADGPEGLPQESFIKLKETKLLAGTHRNIKVAEHSFRERFLLMQFSARTRFKNKQAVNIRVIFLYN